MEVLRSKAGAELDVLLSCRAGSAPFLPGPPGKRSDGLALVQSRSCPDLSSAVELGVQRWGSAKPEQ